MNTTESAPEANVDSLDKESLEQPAEQQNITESIEVNGPKGPEPTRFGDWERKGRCVDF